MRNWKIFCAAILVFTACTSFASEPRTHTEVVRIYQYGDTTGQCFVQDLRLYAERWDTLAQTRFWRKVMRMPPDSAVINIASSRQVIDAVLLKDWDAQTEKRKEVYRDSIREYYCLDSKARIFVTSGKNHFYNFRKVLPTVNRGVQVFQDNNVDPWYAQAILLIESPARLQKSPVGAYGSFQLMRGVAVRMGLKVNRYVDERKNLVKSARAAGKFLNTVCIPETRKLLDRHGIAYNESDLWFRLLVLHVYHAGAANVSGVIAKIGPRTGDMELIQTLWRTEHGRFRNASQNYSQVALASLLELDALVYRDCSHVEATHAQAAPFTDLPVPGSIGSR